MSFRAWLSIATFGIIAVIIFFSRHELYRAWLLLENVNIGILMLLIPGQIFVYYAGAEMMFSYLREKKIIGYMSPLVLARMALEMNFVNHVLPSGGVSGLSYMSWRLSKVGVSAGRGMMAQVVRYAMGFVAFIVLLIVAVVIVTIDGSVNRWIILVSSALVTVMLVAIVGGIFLVSSQRRMDKFATWLVRIVNKFVRKLTFGRRQRVMQRKGVQKFFDDMHTDYVALRHDKRVLIKPFIWGLLFNIADVALFMITFWALGVYANPAPILIAYGVAAMTGFFVITPGGAGAYEAVMVAFLAVAGLSQGTAIAGILLTRVILLLGTIALGYIFYQHAIIKYGKKQA
jgi:uncharacterized protein (TIRG00374 family)